MQILGIEMTPILRKSKEAAKHIMKSRSHRDNRPVNSSPRFLRSRGGRGRRLFLTSRSRLASLARGNHLGGNDHRGSRDHHHHRYPAWFNRSDSPYSKCVNDLIYVAIINIPYHFLTITILQGIR